MVFRKSFPHPTRESYKFNARIEGINPKFLQLKGSQNNISLGSLEIGYKLIDKQNFDFNGYLGMQIIGADTFTILIFWFQ